DVGFRPWQLISDRVFVETNVVVVLHRVLGGKLPVSVPFGLVWEDLALLLNPISGDSFLERPHAWRKSQRIIVQIDKNEAIPRLEAVTWKSASLPFEALGPLHVRGSGKGTSGIISPGVVRADEPLCATVSRDDRHEAMAAYRTERAQCTI